MTGGKSPIGYLKAYTTNLYLSKDSQKVTEAIEEGETPPNPCFSVVNGTFSQMDPRAPTSSVDHVTIIERRTKKRTFLFPPGIAAATMFMPETENELSDTQLRVAFDGDAVLFSDESEVIVKQHGLDTFFKHEKEFENKPLAQVTASVPLRVPVLEASPSVCSLFGSLRAL